MSEMVFTIREIHRNGSNQSYPEMVTLNSGDSMNSYVDKVVMHNSNESLFFSGKRCNKVKVLKITNPENGKSIWRELCVYGMTGVKKDVAAIPALSAWELGIMKTEKEQKVTIQKGSVFFFYWNHPVHATRISFQVGLLSLFIGTVSFVLSLITAIL